jgi:putative phosphoribosyl transferase
VRIPSGTVQLEGELNLPEAALGTVIFAHGSGSSRHSPRNKFVARILGEAGLGSILFDLLTREEEIAQQRTRHLRFNIELLARRLVDVCEWITREIPRPASIGLFGASTGGGAALVAAAALGGVVAAVVSRGGRPDLAGEALPRVTSPTLLIVGELDAQVISLNRQACDQLRCEKHLHIVSGASHLFEEPGTLDEVAREAAGWFQRHFRK